jgi:hypothetical protein
MAIPGSVVNIGNLVTPGGDPGPSGPSGPTGGNAFTTTVGSFTVPNVGSTTTVTVVDASWIVVGQLVYSTSRAGRGTGRSVSQVHQPKAGNVLTPLTTPPAGGGGGTGR